MNEITDPLDYLIQCCETAINTGKWKLTKFTILNAKDELSKLRQAKKDLTKEINHNLAFQNVAWARINDRGDLYDLRLQKNPHVDINTIVPLYKKTDGSNVQ